MDVEQAKALRAEFPAETIGKKPQPLYKNSEKGRCSECGGLHGLPAMHLDYVGHAAVTDRLLQVDPSWTWEPVAVDANGLPAFDASKNLWIRLTVAGVTRLGVGDGMNVKECIGDAIRNAAMRFGVALDLWAKEDLRADTTEPSRARKSAPKDVTGLVEAPPEQAPATRTMQRASAGGDSNLLSDQQLRKVNIMLREQGYTDRDRALARLSELVKHPVETSKALTKEEAHRVIEDLEQTASALAEAGAA